MRTVEKSTTGVSVRVTMPDNEKNTPLGVLFSGMVKHTVIQSNFNTNFKVSQWEKLHRKLGAQCYNSPKERFETTPFWGGKRTD